MHCERERRVQDTESVWASNDKDLLDPQDVLGVTFEFGKLWQALHQSVLLLRLWGWSVSLENIESCQKLDWLKDQYGNEKWTPQHWFNHWSQLALEHLEDATNLFNLELKVEGKLGCSEFNKKVQNVSKELYGSDVKVLVTLEQCLKALVKLSNKFGLEANFVENNILGMLKSMSEKKRELQEEFCSAECRTNFVSGTWKELMSDYLERITGIQFALLQARSRSLKTSKDGDTKFFLIDA